MDRKSIYKLLLICNQIKVNEKSITLLKQKRLTNIKNIIIQKKLQAYYWSLLVPKRLKWTENRYGVFWERDVPEMDDKIFKESFRMSRKCFTILCSKMKAMAKKDTNLRKSIPLEKRVAIAVYCLRSSAEYATISRLFGVGKSTVCVILLKFCHEVWNKMSSKYLPPNFLKEEKIDEAVNGFQKMGFPQCLGAIDGCHIEIHPPASEAVDYYNYKGWYSTILFALVDYRYRFTYINVGCPGRCNDSAIFERSTLKKMLTNDILKQKAKIINGVSVPVLIMGDSAFRLTESVMKPYAFRAELPDREKHFNYCLSKCRRVSENAFGHLKARFRRIGKGVDNNIENANIVIKACCVLHNFLNNHNDHINKKWLKNDDKPQPETQDEDIIMFDLNSQGCEIRNAITDSLYA